MERKEILEQIWESNENISKDHDKRAELKEVLCEKYPKIELSKPSADSPKIKTYKINNSYFASKGTCRSEWSRLYSIQDLVTIETSHYCSPDWRSYWDSIDKINLFPKEEDIPEEYDNTSSDQYGSWQYDYLSYDKENKRIFNYSTWNQLHSEEHYFWISPDSTILFPWIETVEECNGWYFHHIIIDNKSEYKNVNKESIQETVNALFDQKRENEKIQEYRKKNGDIWLELPWTTYYSWWYAPRVYMWDQHWTPAHEHSNESWSTDRLLVKFWNPWDHINFYRLGKRYTISIHDDKGIAISNRTASRWNNNQEWWYTESNDSIIQPGQIFINGYDVYKDTISRFSEKQKEIKEKRKNIFTELKTKLIDEYKFTESEFSDICKYAWKWNVIKFLSTIKSMIEISNIQKEEILDAMLDIKYPNEMVFRNYVLIKRKSKDIKEYDVKRVVGRWYAWSYITDTIEWISRPWTFEDAITSLSLALGNWLFKRREFVYSTETLNSEISDLGQKLIDAGLKPNTK